jgi:hypothetical protein
MKQRGRFGVVSTNEGVFMACSTPTNAADDADPERAAPNILDTTPENQAPTFRNQNQVWSVRVIRRGDAVRQLPSHAVRSRT